MTFTLGFLCGWCAASGLIAAICWLRVVAKDTADLERIEP